MAKMPAAAKAPPPTDDDDDDATGAGAADPDQGDDGDDEEEGSDEGDSDEGDEDVILTVCKESDGTYSVIKCDEDDADGEDAAGSADDEDKKTYDSIGAVLKACLDILNEDKSSEGMDGDSDSQFNAGFDENSPAKPAAMPVAQKY